MNDVSTIKPTGSPATTAEDWQRFLEMTDEEVTAAALSDPDGQPWTEEELARVRFVPRSRTLRRALRLTQQQFAERYHIPLGTLRDWEQMRSEPDQAARAYLKVIARHPDLVAETLAAGGNVPA